MDTLEDRQKFERNAATADRALEVLAAVVPEETSMLAGLAGKPLAKAGAYRETEANAEALLGQAERILNLQKQITEEKTAALRLLAEAESLKPWQKLGDSTCVSGDETVCYLSRRGRRRRLYAGRNLRFGGKTGAAA